MNPQAKLVAGFGPIMPTFQGQVTEEQLMQMMAFIKSLQVDRTRQHRRRRRQRRRRNRRRVRQPTAGTRVRA